METQTGSHDYLDEAAEAVTSGNSHDASNEGEGEASGGGKPKNAKLQEKNRLAQRRFRERQKLRVSSLQQQIDELTDTVKKLTVTKHDLDTRNSLLESVLTVKDEQLRVMRERGQVMSQKIKEVGGSNSGTITIYGPDQQQIAVVLATERLADDSRLILALSDMLNLYVKQLRQCVELVKEGRGGDLAGKKLEQVVSGLFQQFDVVQKEGPSSLLKWLVSHYDEHSKKREGNQSEEQLYDGIVELIKLTPEQAAQMWDLYQTYLSNLREVLQERIRIQGLTSTNISELTGMYSVKRANDFLHSQEAVAMYKDGLLRQQNLLFDLVRTVFRGVLSPLQSAETILGVQPLICDAIQLAQAAHRRFHQGGSPS
uniref:BZIP domain-containing protein n=1 Tax=Tetraselmis sp. GSL018 TaxID=582737 RepID=A0A061SCG9_9CHLO|mmetsp:Transcript_11028/g.26153  ORF Transcript_11028/g.26153 Transcript_11028/m.26153 type:complete len:370 (-) Transcript_11028:12-1121(-)